MSDWIGKLVIAGIPLLIPLYLIASFLTNHKVSSGSGKKTSKESSSTATKKEEPLSDSSMTK